MNATPLERPRLLIVADPDGSGKTTVTERGLAHVWFHDCEYINPDLIARDEVGDWNSPSAVLQAVQVAAKRRELATSTLEVVG
jgi:predicted ABC-type ATPase